MFSKMVDMALAAGDRPAGMPEGMDAPRYPYGLCISLTEAELEKLGYGTEALPEVGDMCHLMAMGTVTAVSCNETDGGKRCRVEIQITHLSAETEDDEAAEAA